MRIAQIAPLIAFERRFSVERMADDYLAAYRGLREPQAAEPGIDLADVA